MDEEELVAEIDKKLFVSFISDVVLFQWQQEQLDKRMNPPDETQN